MNVDLEAAYHHWLKTGELPAEEEVRQALLIAETQGGIGKELPLEYAVQRDKGLNSPAYFATEIIDHFYKKHFEPVHYQLMDEVIGPYLLNETVKIDGISYEPIDYLGLLVLFPRGTFKSSIMGLMMFWIMLYRKLRLDTDCRVMYVHQVKEKAIERSDVVRNNAKHNERLCQRYPEFRGKEGQWDQQHKWRWPNFTTYGAAEYSFIAYGETSDKTGGHYTDSFIDDYETEKSVTTPEMREATWLSYENLDNLKDLTAAFNPWVVCGTTYHHDGVHKRIERAGGYIEWKLPAHKGSPKTLFELAGLDWRDEKQQKRIKAEIKKLDETRADDLNFPHLYPWKRLFQKAQAGPTVYGGQQLLDPSPEGEQRFDHDALDDSWVDRIPSPAECWAVIRCDPAISKKRAADDCAIGVGLIDWKGWRWHVDGWAGREKRPTEVIRKLIAFEKKWLDIGYRVKNIGIESVSFQESLAQLCRDGVYEREPRYDGEMVRAIKTKCRVVSIKRSPDMRKQERLLEMDGPIARRELKIWKANPVALKTMTELKEFPQGRDNLLDVLHDYWVQAPVPPRQREAEMAHVHPELAKILRDKMYDESEAPVLRDTSNTIALSNWRN